MIRTERRRGSYHLFSSIESCCLQLCRLGFAFIHTSLDKNSPLVKLWLQYVHTKCKVVMVKEEYSIKYLKQWRTSNNINILKSSLCIIKMVLSCWWRRFVASSSTYTILDSWHTSNSWVSSEHPEIPKL
jgi:hypothetical protein